MPFHLDLRAGTPRQLLTCHPPASQIAIVSSVLVGSTMYLVVSEARRIRSLFYLNPEECVTFEELQDIYPTLESASRGPVSRQRTNVD